LPHGVWLNRGSDDERFLGAIFSNVEIEEGDFFTRPSAGGGGYGDPLERDPDAVCEDVIDGYVTIGRALTDYGVAVREIDADLSQYEVDGEATERERTRIREERMGRLEADPEEIAARYRDGDLDVLDLVRQYAVIVDWGTGELLPNTTRQFRAMVRRRAAEKWTS
jgi:N-methylhydantoinase B